VQVLKSRQRIKALSESGLVLSLVEAYPGLKDEEDKNIV
jgi:hypothetical protein